MFLPRSRQLTAMGKEGVYLEDHQDQLSFQGEGEDISYNQRQYSQEKFKDSSLRFDRRTNGAHSDEVYQNGSYLGKCYDTCHKKLEIENTFKHTKMVVYCADSDSFRTYLA